LTARRREVVADEPPHHEDVAQPAFPRGFEDGLEAGVVSEHETGLHLQFLLAGKGDHFPHVREFHRGWFLKVDVLARFQCEQGVRGVVSNVGFHRDDPGALEEFVL
jgi:hypothetical protein